MAVSWLPGAIEQENSVLPKRLAKCRRNLFIGPTPPDAARRRPTPPDAFRQRRYCHINKHGNVAFTSATLHALLSQSTRQSSRKRISFKNPAGTHKNPMKKPRILKNHKESFSDPSRILQKSRKMTKLCKICEESFKNPMKKPRILKNPKESFINPSRIQSKSLGC